MASTYYLRNTTANGLSDTGRTICYDMSSSPGSSMETAVVTLVKDATEIDWTKTEGGDTIGWISGRIPAGGYTLTDIAFSSWGKESDVNDNAGIGYRLYRYQPGSPPTITQIDATLEHANELGTSAGEQYTVFNVTDTAFNEGDRILIVPCAIDVGSMTAGTAELYWNAADGATGDMLISLVPNVTLVEDAQDLGVKVLVGGAWKTVASAKVMVGGAWKDITSVKKMVGGAWK